MTGSRPQPLPAEQTPHQAPSCGLDALSTELPPRCSLMRAIYIMSHMMMRVIDRVAQPEGMTGARWLLLVVVRDADEALTISQIADRLMISPQNVSRMISSLEAEGLVARDTTGPGRTVRVSLTETGIDRVSTCDTAADDCGDRMAESLTDEEIARTTEVLERMIRNTARIESEFELKTQRTPPTQESSR
jgi:DNA-binding MarR family transcriptional regulator